MKMVTSHAECSVRVAVIQAVILNFSTPVSFFFPFFRLNHIKFAQWMGTTAVHWENDTCWCIWVQSSYYIWDHTENSFTMVHLRQEPKLHISLAHTPSRKHFLTLINVFCISCMTSGLSDEGMADGINIPHWEIYLPCSFIKKPILQRCQGRVLSVESFLSVSTSWGRLRPIKWGFCWWFLPSREQLFKLFVEERMTALLINLHLDPMAR